MPSTRKNKSSRRKSRAKKEKQQQSSQIPLLSVDDIKEDGLYSLTELKRLFTIRKNRADGNCLFLAFSQLLYGDDHAHKSLRQKVCHVYETIEAKVLRSGTDKLSEFEHNVYNTMLLDEEGDGVLMHYQAVCNDKVYTSHAEIYILSTLFNVDVTVFRYFGTEFKSDVYKSVSGKPLTTFYLLHTNDPPHYEAMYLRDNKDERYDSRSHFGRCT